MSLDPKEKQKIIKALEEDREFRYALMGLLGYKEVLDRIIDLGERFAKLEERFAKLEERFADLEERFIKLEERVAKLEERFAKLEERFADLEERFIKLEERVAKLEERFAKLEERFADLEERFIKLEERFAKLEERFADLEERFIKLEEEARETRRVVAVIAHRYGVMSEAGFRETMKYILQDLFGVAKVEKITIYDEKGLVYGHPANVDIDVLVRDREHILIEIKSRTSRGDVAELYRIGKLYEERTGVKPRLVIVSGFIEPGAIETARELDVEIKPISKDLVGTSAI